MKFSSAIQTLEKSKNTSSRPELSIIIVNYKTKSLTLNCIRSIYQHLPTASFEIIVLDNGSRDNLESFIMQEFPDIKFLEVGWNVGFARANNLGIQNAHGDFILLLNSDTRLMDDTLQSMLDFMQFHPEIGVLGPRHVDRNHSFVPSCGRFPNFRREIIRKIIHYRLSINDYQLRYFLDQKQSDQSIVDWVSGSCLLVRRKSLMDAGLLDERFFMYFEDIDLCKRIQQKGWRIQYYPEKTILHYGGQSGQTQYSSCDV